MDRVTIPDLHWALSYIGSSIVIALVKLVPDHPIRRGETRNRQAHKMHISLGSTLTLTYRFDPTVEFRP
jgi:hypothetical protein